MKRVIKQGKLWLAPAHLAATTLLAIVSCAPAVARALHQQLLAVPIAREGAS